LGKGKSSPGIYGHSPLPILSTQEDKEEILVRKLPGLKNFGSIALRIPKGIAPTGKIHKMNPFSLEACDEVRKLCPIVGLQGLPVIVDRANLKGKEDLG
jgi:hypothetical protein